MWQAARAQSQSERLPPDGELLPVIAPASAEQDNYAAGVLHW